MADNVNASAVIGLLIGFLVVGVIGVYIGDEMIAATNLSVFDEDGGVQALIESPTASWTAPAGVYSVDVTTVGGGGGGGSGKNSTFKGGGAGGAGRVDTYYDVAVIPGTVYTTSIGAGGAGGAGGTPTVGRAGTIGGQTSITIAGTTYPVLIDNRGAAGTNGSSSNTNGVIGTAGWASGISPVAGAGSPGTNSTDPDVIPGSGGLGATGWGASGSGGGVGDADGNGAGGAGAKGAIGIRYYTATSYDSPLTTSQHSVVETFELGVLLCKIIIIVSIASLVFTLLQRTGLIPRFGGGDEGM